MNSFIDLFCLNFNIPNVLSSFFFFLPDMFLSSGFLVLLVLVLFLKLSSYICDFTNLVIWFFILILFVLLFIEKKDKKN